MTGLTRYGRVLKAQRLASIMAQSFAGQEMLTKEVNRLKRTMCYEGREHEWLELSGACGVLTCSRCGASISY